MFNHNSCVVCICGLVQEREKRALQSNRPIASPQRPLARGDSLAPMMTPVGILELGTANPYDTIRYEAILCYATLDNALLLLLLLLLLFSHYGGNTCCLFIYSQPAKETEKASGGC
jgi:hypothetical protein